MLGAVHQGNIKQSVSFIDSIKNKIKCSTKTNKNKLCMRAMSEVATIFYLFMETSSIHGFNHITKKKRHSLEYLVWLLAIIIAVAATVYVSLSTWNRYMDNPTVVSIERNYQEWNTTLPALTLCFQNKIDYENFDSPYMNEITSSTNSEAALNFLEQLANSTFETFGDIKHFSGLKPKEYLNNVVEMRFKVQFYHISNSNSDLFDSNNLTMTMTEMGLCYTYNSAISSYNDPYYWKANNWSFFSSYKMFAASPLDGDIYAQIIAMNSGAMIYYHNPLEVADSSSKGSLCSNFTYKTLDISAQSIVSTREIRSLSVKQRKCKFLDESDLSISPVYSYNLCRMECRVKLSNKLCGCIPYFYRPTGKYKTCDIEGMDCLGKYSDVLATLRYTNKKKVDCFCYPPCDDVNYKIDREDAVKDWEMGTSVKWGLIKYPRLRFKRDIIFGISELLVAMGGTAGLFFGCSVLSLVEIIYFFTLRLFLLFKNKKPLKT